MLAYEDLESSSFCRAARIQPMSSRAVEQSCNDFVTLSLKQPQAPAQLSITVMLFLGGRRRRILA